jgi:hypothetical protein
MAAYEQVATLADQLTLAEKARLLEHLSMSLKHDLEAEAFKRMPYEQFIALTYGMFAADPIERNQPPYPDVRDELE